MQSINSFWFSINQFFRKRDPPPVVKAAPYPPPAPTILQPHLRSILRSQNVRLAEQAQGTADYKLVITGSCTITSEQQQQQVMHADIAEDVSQLADFFQQISITDERLTREDGKHPEVLLPQGRAVEGVRGGGRREFELKKEYQSDICDYLGLKYSKEKAEYPVLDFEQYKLIREYWDRRNKGHSEIKVTGFECVQKLTFKALGGLQHGEWLNDDVINIYLQMMEKKLIRESPTPYRILNTYFATSTLEKSETQIGRVLKKKALEKGQVLIMPINNRNHWYFAVFQEGKLVVHDSMKHSENYYIENPIFRNALKFARMFYEQEYQVVVRGDYPQQDNYYDCGVFMLMGIRDILRRKQQWSYHQGDIRFKRLQIAQEVLQERLMFSDD